ncbi:MAG: hypothetical protein J5379_08665 [Clostridiales bacterium]|nr:hypothetical protein [Clostridiales bacterium]
MKKFLSIMLAVATILSVTACSGKGNGETKKKSGSNAVATESEVKGASKESSKETKDSKGGKAGSSGSSDKSSGKEAIWEYTDKGDFSALLPQVEEVTATAKDGEEITLYTTSICTPKDEMLKKIKEDDFVKSFGPLLDYYKENGTANEGQDNQWSFKYSDGVFAAKTNENKCAELAASSPFELQYDYETASFTNENRVTLGFVVEDINDAATQENIQRLVKEVYGEEIADVLLFAKEQDAAQYEKDPNHLMASVTKDDLMYVFSRSVMDFGSLGKQVLFRMEVRNTNKNVHPYDGGYRAKVSEFKALPNALFGGDIGVQDFMDVRNFGNKFYANMDFGDNLLPGMETNEYTIEQYICEDGREYYTAEFYKYEPSDLHIKYNLRLINGEPEGGRPAFSIIASSTRLHGDIKDDRQALLDQANYMLKAMFGTDYALQISEGQEDTNGEVKIERRIPVSFCGSDVEQVKLTVWLKKSEVSGNIASITIGT